MTRRTSIQKTHDMFRNIQQDSDSDSSPNCGQSQSETNQVLPESQRNDSVPDLEASNCATGSMPAGNAQENQDSDAEPDACLPATHGCDSVPSVSKDYVPWFETLVFPFQGIIPDMLVVYFFLSLTCYCMVLLAKSIRVMKSGSDNVFLELSRKATVILFGGVLDAYLSTLYKLDSAFHSDVSRSKAAFGNGSRGSVTLIACASFHILLCVGILVLIYYASSAHFYPFVGWYTGPLPQSFRGCEARVGPAQSSLFTEHIYASQFARITAARPGLFMGFDMQAFDAIRHDQILCNQGFIGNSDLCGLGSRVSLYLQWLTALLINNFVPGIRHEFRKVYLAYSLGLCIATFVFTFSKDCTFAVEIEILYWAYWGGFLCVFTTPPSYMRLGSEVKWIGLDWITGINYFLHILMFYHSTFFWNYGYDQLFSRMPCGTYHFFFAPLLDPSKSFWFFRDALTVMLDPLNIPLIFIIPTVILSLMSEIKGSICDSSVYQNLGIYLRSSGRPDSETVLEIDPPQVSLSSRFRNSLRALGFLCVRRYRGLRVWCSLPPHRRGGIRLLTPVDIKQRKYVNSTGE